MVARKTATKDKAVEDAYWNKFIIPLDFEMLDSLAPYYQAGLGNRLCYEITFNDYNRVINSAVASPDAEYEISNISLEYEIVTQPTLARSIATEYQNMALLYDRILRHRKIPVNKSDTTWNWSFNSPCKSLKHILVLFKEEKSYARDTGKFYNPKKQKVSVIVEGKPNALKGITLQIEKKSESPAGVLNAYIYLIMDAQLNIQNGAYISALY